MADPRQPRQQHPKQHPKLAPDPRLRLILITDGAGDPSRLDLVVRAALRGGVRCVQIREPRWTARILQRECERLRPICDECNALLLVNDRLDVVASGAAHGAQIGHRSLLPEAARRAVGSEAMLGFSAHSQDELDLAAPHCDFALLSPVWATSSKPGAAFLGVAQAQRLTARAPLPVAWLGGVARQTLAELADVPMLERPFGVAVRSAIAMADDPERAARELLAAWPDY
ncbi:MAG: thiamine phosphate synthase [Planctomycetota bacterium]